MFVLKWVMVFLFSFRACWGWLWGGGVEQESTITVGLAAGFAARHRAYFRSDVGVTAPLDGAGREGWCRIIYGYVQRGWGNFVC